jgi:rhodanese-related sulfurtransferase
MTDHRLQLRPILSTLVLAAAAAAQASIVLPASMLATALQRELALPAATVGIVDLRPAWQFAEWHLPGAVNVALEQVAAHVAALPADRRVVLVDRDGTTAFAVAGALLARDARRPLHVLVGGLSEYWRVAVLGATGSAAPAPTSTKATLTPKKRGAGC